MRDHSSPRSVESTGSLLPPRFWLSFWLSGCGYMFLMLGASAALENERLIDVWWWTAIPFAWLAAGLIHWRHWSISAAPKWRAAIKRHPGYSIFLFGMAVQTFAFGLMTSPSTGEDLSSQQMRWFEIGSVGIVAIALSVSFALRRRAPKT